jgi:hypothetical protein
MFRLLTGRYLHDASGAFDLLMKMGRDPAPPIARVAPLLPPNICRVIDRALAFDREQRYPDARSMHEDVRAVLRGEEPPNALRLLGSSGPPISVAAPAPVTTAGTSSSEVPIYLSGFSSGVEVSAELVEGISTDREPSPEVKRVSAPEIIMDGAVEMTLPSPVFDPGPKPPKR